MPQVTFNVPDAAKEDLLAIWPNNKEYIDDPDWVDDGTIAPQILKYSDWVWLKKKFKKNYNDIRHNGKLKRARLAVTRTDTIE
jgi:hypothetical protein